MLRHLSQPLHTGVFHPHIMVKTLCDGINDQRLALFAQQFDKAGFLFNQRVDARGFAVKILHDMLALANWWHWY